MTLILIVDPHENYPFIIKFVIMKYLNNLLCIHYTIILVC